MDKLDFIQKAPVYYLMAICHGLEKASGLITQKTLSGLVSSQMDVIGQEALFNAAIKRMNAAGLINIVPDDFGPVLYSKTARFTQWWSSEASHEEPLIDKLQSMFSDEREDWLVSALTSVNREYWTKSYSKSDFDTPLTGAVWQPIPLERDDPTLQKAVEAIDAAIKDVTESNGYANDFPGERQLVLTNLRSLSKSLKEEAQLNWMIVKTFGIEPLTRVIERFGNAAVGMAATVAKQALMDWLKKNVAKIFELLS